MTDLKLPSQLELIDLKKKAKKIVVASVGEQPTFEQFEENIIPDYPRWLTRATAILLLVMFLAAANISLFRLFNISRDHFLEDIHVGWQAAIVGISVFLIAECAVIVSFVVMEIYHLYGWKRNILWFIIAGGLSTAYVGNYSLVRPDTLFGIIETFFPPTAVIGVALVAETLITEGAKERQATKKAFEAANQAYKLATANPEKHPDFFRYFYYEVKDFIYKANKRYEERKEYLDGLTDQEWVQVIKKALETDALYLEAMSAIPVRQAQIRSNSANEPSERTTNNGNGYKKNMGAMEMALQYFVQFPDRLDTKLDDLIPEISNYYGEKVGRTSIHEAKHEFKRLRENV